jgi:hypothetical protein
VRNAEFRVLDFWSMSPETLGGTFDVVLDLGLLYHLADPLRALERTKAVARGTIVLDTQVFPSARPLMAVRWEEPEDIRSAATAGIVVYPSKRSVGLMLRHLRFGAWFEVPVRTQDMPPVYRNGRRASWIITA